MINLETQVVANFQFISQPIPELLKQLKVENSNLPDLMNLHRRHENRELPPDYTVQNGILLFRHRYYVGENSNMKYLLLHEFHATPMARHTGVTRTLLRLSSTFFWPKMRNDVKHFIATCLTCQQTK